MATITVTESNFDTDVLASGKPVLVDFWAEWCGPCRMVAPALDELSGELAAKLTVAKVNIDDEPGLATRYGIRSIPTMLIFKDGDVVASRLGAAAKGALKSWIESAV